MKWQEKSRQAGIPGYPSFQPANTFLNPGSAEYRKGKNELIEMLQMWETNS
jgi:hypothetical protein